MNPDHLAASADEMLRVSDDASLVEPISGRESGFSIEAAYAVSAEVLRRRERAGWRRVGRKIGFTNRTIWDQYGVYQPIFGYMYDRTVTDATRAGESYAASLSLDGLAQPLIEPEIVFKLRDRPPRTNDPAALLRAVEWLAHGFEIVQCHFPDWRFAPADTIADGGLHGRYVAGPPVPVESADIGSLVAQLASFRISLFRDGELMAEGGGELVLDSPLNALAHLVELLDALPDHPPLEPGELVTTGTLTTALPIARGETWSTRLDGLPLPGLELRFV